MKQTIIKYDKIAHERAIAKINAIRRIIDKFKTAYSTFKEDTEMDDLGQDALMVIMEDERRAIERMIDSYVAKQPKPLHKYSAEACYGALNKHLDPILREINFWKSSSTNGVGTDYFPYELARPKNWPWKDLTLAPDDAFFEKIRPYYELTISSELDHALLEKYEALATAYNELQELAEKNDVRIPIDFKTLFRLEMAFLATRVSLHPEVFLPSVTKTAYKEKERQILGK